MQCQAYQGLAASSRMLSLYVRTCMLKSVGPETPCLLDLIKPHRRICLAEDRLDGSLDAELLMAAAASILQRRFRRPSQHASARYAAACMASCICLIKSSLEKRQQAVVRSVLCPFCSSAIPTHSNQISLHSHLADDCGWIAVTTDMRTAHRGKEEAFDCEL